MANSMLDAMNEARNEGGTYQRVEVITGRQRRRRWAAEEKARIVAESLEADANISEVARRHGVARGLLTVWRRQLSSNGKDQRPEQSFAVVSEGGERAGRRAGCGDGDVAGGAGARADRDRGRWRPGQG